MFEKYKNFIAVGLLLVMAAFMVPPALQESPTMDEPRHLVRGLAYWWEGNAHFSYAHPPFGNALIAAFSAFTSKPFSFWEHLKQDPDPRNIIKAIDIYIGERYDPLVRQLRESRLAMVFFTLLLGLYIFSWTDRAFGWKTALLTLFFFSTNAPILAHGHYVTTDLPLTVMMTLTILELIKFLRRPRFSNWILIVTLAGLCVVTKHSGVVIPPFVLGVVLYNLIKSKGSFSIFVGRKVRSGALYAGALAFGVLFIVNGAYRFQETGWSVQRIFEQPEIQDTFVINYKQKMMETVSLLRVLPKSFRIPLPYTYLFGLTYVQAHNIQGHPSYFMGSPTRTGKWLFFPVMLLVKNSTGTAILLILALLFFFQGNRKREGRAMSLPVEVMALFLIFYFGLAMTSRINIGIRHLLPIIPILLILLSHFVVQRWPKCSGRGQAILSALCISSLIEVLLIFPNFMGYFNLFAGGPYLGPKINVMGDDWGQDLSKAAEVLLEKGIHDIYYSRGHIRTIFLAVLNHHGINVTPLACGKVPPSGSWVLLHRAYEQYAPRNCLKWEKHATQAVNIYDHIGIYRMN